MSITFVEKKCEILTAKKKKWWSAPWSVCRDSVPQVLIRKFTPEKLVMERKGDEAEKN